MPCHLHAHELCPLPPRAGWEGRGIPPELGIGQVWKRELAAGLTLIWSRYRPRYPLVEHSHMDAAQPVATLTLAQSGCSIYRPEGAAPLEFRAGQSTAMVWQQARGQRHYRADERVCQWRLQVSTGLMRQYGLDHWLEARSGAPRVLQQAPLNGLQWSLLQDLSRNRAGPHAGLVLHQAALGLLGEQVRQRASEGPVAGWSPGVRARIFQARDLIMAHSDHPWTLARLSAQVGTNECTLKQGFRQLLGSSMHRMLTQVRMERAWSALAQGTPVGQVARQAGFRHVSSFSGAFLRYFGQRPSQVRGRARAL